MKKRFERRHSRWYEKALLSLPFQLLIGLPFVLLPVTLERWGWGFWHHLNEVRINTILAIALCFVMIALTQRRILRFPGAHVAAYLVPTITAVFLLAIAVLFFTREGYSRQVLFFGYGLCLVWFYGGYFLGRRYRRLKLAVVPIGSALDLESSNDTELRRLKRPDLEEVRFDGVVADLRSPELSAEWEKFIARCTLSCIPVYHVKQISESMTGRVQIEHLAENEFGSLQPSELYSAFKRMIDLSASLLLTPFLLLILGVVALWIKQDSKGPAFFIQERMGYRGRIFKVYKFRSMYIDQQGRGFTEGEEDPRITPVGKIIRKYRIDELPQLFNVIQGNMSFIGPRPESRSLSDWYERDVPFFSYRHIVRPGISGWAQVEQGYAAEVDGMKEKLQYDFYYIKHFSLWLDILIVFKTIKTIVTGFGAR